ncbi:MAG: hypothetical protein Kapaf2KO_04420 [Candidatus Kapaibacteriales bacterium]
MKGLVERLCSHFQKYVKTYLFIILPFFAILIGTYRFNGNESKGHAFISYSSLDDSLKSPDVINYDRYVQAFRDDVEILDSVEPPFSQRPLQPFLASLLPFDNDTSLNMINLAASLISLLLIWLIMGYYQVNVGVKVLSIFLFVFSFPYFYYTSVSRIDPLAVMVVALGIWVYFRFGLLYSLLILPIAIAQKEVALLYMLFVAFDYFKPTNIKTSFKTIILLLAVGLIYLLAKKMLLPGGEYSWTPEIYTLVENLSRPRACLSVLLSLFPLLIVLAFFRENIRMMEDIGYLAGILSIALLIIYSFIAAYTDGRFVFIGYPILIIYLSILINRHLAIKRA